MKSDNQTSRSPSSRVSIDGSKVKFIRESKGLTQLYISTFLGVTTDTVSRWENRKYPTVKWENVEKLAEALDVDVSEIIDYREDRPEKPDVETERTTPVKTGNTRKSLIAIVILIMVVLTAGIIMLNMTRKEMITITAARFLPKHIPAGQTFPVVIKVDAGNDQPFSFILRENLPENFLIVKGIPEIASKDQQKNSVKWIGSSRQSPFFLAYLVKAGPESKPLEKVSFMGQIKADNAPGFEQNVTGDSVIEISDFHWADSNADGIIDDEEILMVYSSADALKSLGIDMDSIMKIWSAGSYSWDPDKNEYRVHP